MYPAATIPNTQVRIITATRSGQVYRISIALPSSYNETRARYPVLYLLDANWYFGMVTETARLLREGFLQQNSFDPIDSYSPVEKQIRMLNLILYFHQRAQHIIKQGALISAIHELPVVDTLIRMKTQVDNENLSRLDEIHKEISEQMQELEAEYV